MKKALRIVLALLITCISFNIVACTPHTHVWDDGVTTTYATPTSTGERTFTCQECKKTRTEVIPVIIPTLDGVSWETALDCSYKNVTIVQTLVDSTSSQQTVQKSDGVNLNQKMFSSQQKLQGEVFVVKDGAEYSYITKQLSDTDWTIKKIDIDQARYEGYMSSLKFSTTFIEDYYEYNEEKFAYVLKNSYAIDQHYTMIEATIKFHEGKVYLIECTRKTKDNMNYQVKMEITYGNAEITIPKVEE